MRLERIGRQVENIQGIQLQLAERYVVGPFLSKQTTNDEETDDLLGNNDGILLIRKYAIQRVSEEKRKGIAEFFSGIMTGDWTHGRFSPQIQFPQVAVMPHRTIQRMYNSQFMFDRETQAYSW